jgi:hypothetical protein
MKKPVINMRLHQGYPEPGEWTYCIEDADLVFEEFRAVKRKRCCSCGELINIGSICIRYPRRRYPYNEVEARIVGADWDLNEEPPIRMADHYHCEECGEIWLNLYELGFECLQPNEDMRESLKEYHEMTGFKPISD